MPRRRSAPFAGELRGRRRPGMGFVTRPNRLLHAPKLILARAFNQAAKIVFTSTFTGLRIQGMNSLRIYGMDSRYLCWFGFTVAATQMARVMIMTQAKWLRRQG